MTILVAEDDPVMGRLLVRGFRAEGHDVEWVSTGVDALTALSRADVRLAVVDVMLPLMTGFELCSRARATGVSVPIILLTARDAVEDRVFGLDAGADDYLTKPFAFVELAARVRALLRRDVSAVGQLALGSVQLDSLSRIVRIGEHELSLSPKEFALLRVLMQRAGRPTSRTEILEQVWGSTEHIDPNIVDQYISYVRRKLEPARDVVIRTRRGVGYSIELASDDASA